MIKQYIKKPIVIEAIQWTGNNVKEVESFIGDFGVVKEGYVDIGTLDGLVVASKSDFIIKGIKGEIYPCKPDIFEKTYKLVEIYGE